MGRWALTEAMIDFATSARDVAAVKALFIAYTEWIPIDLGFQGLADEMDSFPDIYEFLLLAKDGDRPMGAVALKKHSDDVCEMKRLFVYPDYHGRGLGEALSIRLMDEAKKLGFKKMLLDSLRRLEAAVALYRKLGFEEVEPYNFNPEDDVVYMERVL